MTQIIFSFSQTQQNNLFWCNCLWFCARMMCLFFFLKREENINFYDDARIDFFGTLINFIASHHRETD